MCTVSVQILDQPTHAHGAFPIGLLIVLVFVFQVCGTPDSRRWPTHEELPSFGSMMPKSKYPDRLKQHLVSDDPKGVHEAFRGGIT